MLAGVQTVAARPTEKMLWRVKHSFLEFDDEDNARVSLRRSGSAGSLGTFARLPGNLPDCAGPDRASGTNACPFTKKLSSPVEDSFQVLQTSSFLDHVQLEQQPQLQQQQQQRQDQQQLLDKKQQMEYNSKIGHQPSSDSQTTTATGKRSHWVTEDNRDRWFPLPSSSTEAAPWAQDRAPAESQSVVDERLPSIIMHNLWSKCDSELLKEVLSHMGVLQYAASVNIPLRKSNRTAWTNRGYGFVTLKRWEDVFEVLRVLNKAPVQFGGRSQRIVTVELSRAPAYRPTHSQSLPVDQ